MWKSLQFKLFKALSYIVLDLGLYYKWSRLGRVLYESEYRFKPIRTYKNFDELQKAMATAVWRPDPWWQLGDMISHPATVEAKLQKGEPIGDCDDFSVYQGQALAQIVLDDHGHLDGMVILDINLLTVPWLDENGMVSGHNVCVFSYYNDKDTDFATHWAWLSNWYDGRIQYYGPDRSAYESVESIVAHICQLARGTNLRWARVSLDLRRVLDSGTV